MENKRLFLDYENGYWKERNGAYYFHVPIIPMPGIYTYLGMVKLKNDGRYEWFRVKDKHFDTHFEREHPLQGVCATLENAKEKAIADVMQMYRNHLAGILEETGERR